MDIHYSPSNDNRFDWLDLLFDLFHTPIFQLHHLGVEVIVMLYYIRPLPAKAPAASEESPAVCQA